MSKRILSFILIAMLFAAMCPLTVFAEDYAGGEDWNVWINSEGKMESNFSSDMIADKANEMQPGDVVVFRVSVENDYKETADVYMSNTVIKSLEEQSARGAKGGAYSYRLQYTAPGASEPDDIFNSDTVGGDMTSGDREGMHEATSALEGYFLMDDLEPGEKGLVTLTVSMEGDTQGNAYQDTTGDIALVFATVFRNSTTPNTGFSNNLLPLYIVMFVSGAALLIVAFLTLRRRKREED